MVNKKLKYIYDKSPIPVQNVILSIKGYQLEHRRHGRKFEEIRRRVSERQEMRKEALETYQQERLKNFLTECRASDYWRRVLEANEVEAENDDVFGELEKLPVLTKDKVKANRDGIVVADAGNLLEIQTSGTTGNGLQFWQTKAALREQWAIWWRYWDWHGIGHNQWMGYFGSSPIVPYDQSDPPYWRINYPQKRVMFSTFHLTEDAVNEYIRRIKESDLKWLHGYSSALTLFSNLILESGIEPPSSLDIVTVGAENLLDYQRETISTALDVEVRQHYGLAESVANISECPEGNLHVDEDFSYVEFVPVEGSDNKYHIVGTNWTNPAFPLLRYDTGDIARVTGADCPCDRSGRVVDDIAGRSDDYVLLPNGARVWGLNQVFTKFSEVNEAQIYQLNVYEIEIRIVRGEGYSSDIERDIEAAARNRLGPEIDIQFDYRESIPKTSSGKLRFVVSDIDEAKVSTKEI